MHQKTTSPPLASAVETLKQSPLFNLSLASKELFHSNFLYWLANNYAEGFGAMFCKVLDLHVADCAVEDVYREKNNLDLIFRYRDGPQVVIENKIKSIAYPSQLDRYAKSVDSETVCVLLTLSDPLFFQGASTWESDNVCWRAICYRDLLPHLAALGTSIGDPYHHQLVADYVTFLGALVEVDSCCGLASDDVFSFHNKRHDAAYRLLSQIRLHDFYLKRKYECLAYCVYQRLAEEELPLLPFGQKLNWKAGLRGILLFHDLTRAQGIMEMKYVLHDNLLLAIQIQGSHYRMVVEDQNGSIAPQLKNPLAESLWFSFERTFPDEEPYPRGDKQFNKFGRNFFYRSVKLGTERSIGSIASAVCKDVRHIHQHKGDILKLVAALS